MAGELLTFCLRERAKKGNLARIVLQTLAKGVEFPRIPGGSTRSTLRLLSGSLASLAKLVHSEDDVWIEARRAPRRQPAGKCRYQRDRHNDGDQCGGVGRLNAE